MDSVVQDKFRRMKKLIINMLLISFAAFAVSCKSGNKGKTDTGLSGDLIIFHAGSLSMPFKAIADSFMSIHPNVKILAEASGSIDAARKITELGRDCDIMASADYSVIDKLLIPEFASENIKFASNEMAIVFTENSKYASEIDTANWASILLRKDVIIGRADPNADPCGYRTLLTLRLAKNEFEKEIRSGVSTPNTKLEINKFPENILSKNERFIRPKEVDLLALLETESVDYIFLYKSVAVQHKLKYIQLPAEINLSSPLLNGLYSKVETSVRGSKPGETMVMKGDAMVYSLTILNNAPNKAVAKAFVDYLLSGNGGRKILKEMGQAPVYDK